MEVQSVRASSSTTAKSMKTATVRPKLVFRSIRRGPVRGFRECAASLRTARPTSGSPRLRSRFLRSLPHMTVSPPGLLRMGLRWLVIRERSTSVTSPRQSRKTKYVTSQYPCDKGHRKQVSFPKRFGRRVPSQRSARRCVLIRRRRLELPDRVVLRTKDWPIPAVYEEFRLNQDQRQQLNWRIRDNYPNTALGHRIGNWVGPVVRGVSYKREEIGRTQSLAGRPEAVTLVHGLCFAIRSVQLWIANQLRPVCLETNERRRDHDVAWSRRPVHGRRNARDFFAGHETEAVYAVAQPVLVYQGCEYQQTNQGEQPTTDCPNPFRPRCPRRDDEIANCIIKREQAEAGDDGDERQPLQVVMAPGGRAEQAKEEVLCRRQSEHQTGDAFGEAGGEHANHPESKQRRQDVKNEGRVEHDRGPRIAALHEVEKEGLKDEFKSVAPVTEGGQQRDRDHNRGTDHDCAAHLPPHYAEIAEENDDRNPSRQLNGTCEREEPGDRQCAPAGGRRASVDDQ